MNFGKGIFVAFILFILFIGTLSVICLRQDINLVSTDYYQQELKHQDKMEQIQNTNRLKVVPLLSVANEEVIIIYDDFYKLESGKLELLRPSDAKQDRQFELKGSEANTQVYPVKDFHRGLYRVSMRWKMEGKEYFFEKLIVI